MALKVEKRFFLLGYLKETIIFASRKTGKPSSLAHPDSYREVRVSGDVHNFFDLHYVYLLSSEFKGIS